ncbi:MAG: hypothetical protein WEE66_01570 [Actinomycetota bacterium]
MIRCSATAVGLLRRAEQAARRFNPSARIRLVPDLGGVRFELTDEPAPSDDVVEHEAGFTLFVASGLSGLVDVAEPHDRLVLVSDDEDPAGAGA